MWFKFREYEKPGGIAFFEDQMKKIQSRESVTLQTLLSLHIKTALPKSNQEAPHSSIYSYS